jgi:hypothetical protein
MQEEVSKGVTTTHLFCRDYKGKFGIDPAHDADRLRGKARDFR